MAASDMAALLIQAKVPAFSCPTGTKMHILDLGTLDVDEGWLLRGQNGGSRSIPNPEHKRRDLIVLACLIEYPGFGCILFETGCSEKYEFQLGAPATDLFPRTSYTEAQRLPAAIKATGNDIKDVKAIVIGHLHLDHAGGLEHFLDTDVPIYVHEEEFKHACWAVATEADLGVYVPDYMDLRRLKWNTFTEDHLDLQQGIMLHLSPGHTPGLCIMQINLEKSGTWIWTTDQFHIAENFEMKHPHGWLQRDHNAWIKSLKMIERLKKLFDAKLIYGHDMDTAKKYMVEKFYM